MAMYQLECGVRGIVVSDIFAVKSWAWFFPNQTMTVQLHFPDLKHLEVRIIPAYSKMSCPSAELTTHVT
jgi:hypothetical protein